MPDITLIEFTSQENFIPWTNEWTDRQNKLFDEHIERIRSSHGFRDYMDAFCFFLDDLRTKIPQSVWSAIEDDGGLVSFMLLSERSVEKGEIIVFNSLEVVVTRSIRISEHDTDDHLLDPLLALMADRLSEKERLSDDLSDMSVIDSKGADTDLQQYNVYNIWVEVA